VIARRLVAREFRNARATMFATTCLVLFCDLIVLANQRIKGGDLSAFDPLVMAGVPLLWFAGFAITRAIVAHEHQQRMRAFLEGLPVGREALIAAKCAVAVMLVVAVAWLQVATLGALGSPTPDVDLTLRVFARMTCVALFVAGAGVAAASLGRYYVVTLVALFLAQVAQDTFGLGASTVTPTALVAKTFTTDRRAIPLVPVVLSVLGALAGSFVALAIACARSGSLATSLFERMTHREGMRWAAGLLVTMLLAHADTSRARHLNTRADHALTAQAVRVEQVGTRSDALPRAHAAVAVARSIVDAPLPTVLLQPRNDVPAGMLRFEAASDDVAVVAFRPSAHDPSPETLASAAAQAALLQRSRGLVLRESTAWVLDGVGLACARWSHIDAPLEHDADVLAPLLAVQREALRVDDLATWRAFRERVGERGAQNVAYTLLRVIAHTRGPDALKSLLRAVFARPWYGSAPAAWIMPSMASAWRASGTDAASATRAWNTTMAPLREGLAGQIAQQPSLSVRLDVTRASSVSRALRLTLTASRNVAPDAQIDVAVWRLVAENTPLVRGLTPGDPDVEGLAWHGTVTAASLSAGVELPAAFTRGDAVLWRAQTSTSLGALTRTELP
jgi:hypothetical protein